MKILHTSDWHLGMYDNGQSLIVDQKFFLDEIYRIIDEHNVDVVIIAGDVFDHAIAPTEAIKLYDEAMSKLCLSMKRDVVIVAGNHDSSDRLSSCSDLLEAAGLHVAGSLTRNIAVASFDDVDIYMLPWFTEGKAKSVFPEEADQIISLESAYKVICDNIRSTMDSGKCNVLVSHAFITDSETSESDRAAVLAQAEHVSARIFDGFDYVALGHIHKPQQVSDKARYSGTPVAYSFGKEEAQEKSVTIFDTETGEQTIVPLKQLHKRKTISGTMDQIMNDEYDDEVKNGYVKVQVADSYVGLELLSKLRSRFENLIEVIGKSYEDENASIRMTMEEFREMESDPIEIFKSFCVDAMGEAPDEHIVGLFREAMSGEEA